MIQRAIVNLDVTVAFFRGEWRSFDLLASLSRVRCPTVVLSGDLDPINPVDDAEDLANALPANVARFKRFAGCGHPVYEDDEPACFAAIAEFLESV